MRQLSSRMDGIACFMFFQAQKFWILEIGKGLVTLETRIALCWVFWISNIDIEVYVYDINRCLLHTNILASLRGNTKEIEVSSMSMVNASDTLEYCNIRCGAENTISYRYVHIYRSKPHFWARWRLLLVDRVRRVNIMRPSPTEIS